MFSASLKGVASAKKITLPPTRVAEGQNQSNYNGDFAAGNGDFVGGDMNYADGDLITLSNGAIVEVTFPPSTLGVGAFNVIQSGPADVFDFLPQVSTTGNGQGFALIPNVKNIAQPIFPPQNNWTFDQQNFGSIDDNEIFLTFVNNFDPFTFEFLSAVDTASFSSIPTRQLTVRVFVSQNLTSGFATLQIGRQGTSGFLTSGEGWRNANVIAGSSDILDLTFSLSGELGSGSVRITDVEYLLG